MSTFRNIRANGVTFVPNSAGRLALFPTDGFLVEQLDDNSIWAWNQTLQMWIPESGSGGGGVSSVGLSLPISVFTVTGSPVTTSGTLAGSFKTQNANTIFAGPSSGAAAAPTFRALTSDDIPSLPLYVLKSGDSIQYLNVEGDPTSGVGYVEFSNNNGLSSYTPPKNFALSAAGADGVIQVLYPDNTGSKFALLDFSELTSNNIYYKFPDVTSGNYHLATWEDSKFLTVTGRPSSNQGYLNFTTRDTSLGTPPTDGSVYMFGYLDQGISFFDSAIGVQSTIRFANPHDTSDWVYQLQGGSGTLAFLSDIINPAGTYLPLAGGTMSLTSSPLVISGASNNNILTLNQFSTQNTDTIDIKNNAGAIIAALYGNQKAQLVLGDSPAGVSGSDAQLFVRNQTSNQKAFVVAVSAGQSVNILEIQGPSFNSQISVGSNFSVGIGYSAIPVNSALAIMSNGASVAAIRARNSSVQSADPIVLESTGGAANLWTISKEGRSFSDAGTTALAGVGFTSSGTKITNTGLSYTATNELSLLTNGVQAIIIDANQKAKFHASTTSAASVNIAAGTAPTSPVEGDRWNDSTMKNDIMFIDGIKQSRVGTIFTQTADQTVTNTVTETTIFGTGIGTLTLPANFLVAGKTIRLKIGGVYSTPIGTPSATIKVKLGSTVIASVTTTALLSNASGLMFQGEALITCRTTGASGTVMTHGTVEYATGVSGTNAIDALNNGAATTTVDTTASKVLDVTITWDSATTTRIAKTISATVEILN